MNRILSYLQKYSISSPNRHLPFVYPQLSPFPYPTSFWPTRSQKEKVARWHTNAPPPSLCNPTPSVQQKTRAWVTDGNNLIARILIAVVVCVRVRVLTEFRLSFSFILTVYLVALSLLTEVDGVDYSCVCPHLYSKNFSYRAGCPSSPQPFPFIHLSILLRWAHHAKRLPTSVTGSFLLRTYMLSRYIKIYKNIFFLFYELGPLFSYQTYLTDGKCHEAPACSRIQNKQVQGQINVLILVTN